MACGNSSHPTASDLASTLHGWGAWVVLSCLYVHKARVLQQLLTKFFAVVLRNTVRNSTLKYGILTTHAKVINHQFKSRHACGQ
jgi:hypothetical protein